MDRIRSFFQKKEVEQEYAPLTEETQFLEGTTSAEGEDEVPFSWVEYGIFALLGVAMLWAWYVLRPNSHMLLAHTICLGTCSSPPLLIFKPDFKRTNGCCRTSSRP